MSTQAKVLWLGLSLVIVHLFSSGQWSAIWSGSVGNTTGIHSNQSKLLWQRQALFRRKC